MALDATTVLNKVEDLADKIDDRNILDNLF